MLRIGTSGWQYRHWRGRFYPAGLPAARWLEHYAAWFAAVEVNNTFYRLPPAETFAAWSRRVPADFRFAIKASRYLTHYQRLRAPEEPVRRLLAHAAPLGRRAGPVLVQLPPDLRVEPDRLDRTLRAFSTAGVPVAVELRHASWFCDEVRAILSEHRAALCLADRGSRPVTPVWRTAEWYFVRFHAGRADPHPCYGSRALASWTARLRAHWPDDAEGWVFFNNDTEGCAVRDAARFAQLARRAGVDVARAPRPGDVAAGPRVAPPVPTVRAAVPA